MSRRHSPAVTGGWWCIPMIHIWSGCTLRAGLLQIKVHFQTSKPGVVSMFVILALKRLRQEDHYESEVSLGYLLNSWATGATEAEISKKKKFLKSNELF